MERKLEDFELNDDQIARVSTPSQMCDRCYQDLDVDRLLDPQFQVSSAGREVMFLDEPGTEVFEMSCPTCVFIHSLGPRRWYQRRLMLCNEAVPTPGSGGVGGEVNGNQRFLAIFDGDRWRRPNFFQHIISETGFLIPVSRTCDRECLVHVVDRSAISYGRITRWLDDCAANHNAACGQTKETKYPLQLYVLDCLTNAIVPLCSGDQYAALSYVWGMAADLARDPEPPIGDARDSAGSSAEIPLTIRDSMEATRCLGYRYLWVDRYCIPQVDISQRLEAIANMDRVYAGAVFTIVALHGGSVHAGLPGVSTRPRLDIQQVLVQNGQLRWTFPYLSSIIDRSVWATRGWTFQEFRLSRRCLFFTDYQVYFSCSEVILSEALPQISSSTTLAEGFNAKYSDQVLDRTSAGHKGFFLDRLKYTKKTLSYQNDILDAFRGIIGLHPFVTFWGIPITCLGWNLDPCVGFSMGLLWVRIFTGQSSSRRPGFPTWSWTSVTAQ